MRGQIGGLNQSVRNAQDGISLIQTAEGALNETHSILNRMRELAVQSSNDTNTTSDRLEIQKEVDQLSTEITRIAKDTQFNTKNLLDNNFSATFHIGANKDQKMDLSINNMKASDLAVNGTKNSGSDSTNNLSISSRGKTLTSIVVATDSTATNYTAGVLTMAQGSKVSDLVSALDKEGFEVGTSSSTNLTNNAAGSTISLATVVTDTIGINVSTQSDSNTSIQTIDNAIKSVSAERSKLGAVQNRLDHTINNLTTTSENLSAAESRIRDVDMAKEMMEFTKNNILNQASTAMLAQANQMPQGVLQLLG